jgi:hypothetical protein
MPVAGQSADANFIVDGESPHENIQEFEGPEQAKHAPQARNYDTGGNFWEGFQVQVGQSQPGLLWLYFLLGAIIVICGFTIILLIKSDPIFARLETSSHEDSSADYEFISSVENDEPMQTEMQEVGDSYVTANAFESNGVFERDDQSILFDEAIVNQPSSVSAYLIVEHMSGEEQMYHLFESNASIGRGKDVYIMLLDNKVSRHHAEICYDDGEYIFVDNQPSNPSHINGEIYSDPYIIRDNDEFIIGETRITFKRA